MNGPSMNATTIAPSLLDVARKLHADKGALLTTRDIAKRMNVSHEWVRRFIAGEIPNPGVKTLESFIAALNDA